MQGDHVARRIQVVDRSASWLTLYRLIRASEPAVNVDTHMQLLVAAHRLCGHRHYVVVGNVSLLGMAQVEAIPLDMTPSMAASCYTLSDPPQRLAELDAA